MYFKKIILKVLYLLEQWVKSSYFFVSFILILSLWSFISITVDVVIRNDIMYYDQVIFDFLSNTASDYMTDFMLFITRFGAEYVVFLMLSLVLVFLFFDRLKEALLLLIATGGAFFLNAFVKDIIDRTRPIVGIPVIQAEGYSFPSGHAMISICFYGVLIYLAFKYIKNIKLKYLIYLILGLLILFIGLSRVYLGVHYLSDVLGGFSLGIFWLSLCILFYRVISITNFSDNS